MSGVVVGEVLRASSRRSPRSSRYDFRAAALRQRYRAWSHCAQTGEPLVGCDEATVARLRRLISLSPSQHMPSLRQARQKAPIAVSFLEILRTILRRGSVQLLVGTSKPRRSEPPTTYGSPTRPSAFVLGGSGAAPPTGLGVMRIDRVRRATHGRVIASP